MNSNNLNSDISKYDDSTNEFFGNLQFCQFQEKKDECIMNYGLTDCGSSFSNLSRCFSNHKEQSLCIPEEEQLRVCFSNKASTLVNTSHNLK